MFNYGTNQIGMAPLYVPTDDPSSNAELIISISVLIFLITAFVILCIYKRNVKQKKAAAEAKVATDVIAEP
eukprot:CAMPEP_0176389252 /NCGR_PEP_ID=MMETSP0126-20121128/38231_1 /TAXON_ID=141414 ORGANISM="Strombidinopsis acuminatum, Strain SPMC142" /NCGR_SAMPLE_ID=MMETSP0126 /ASSEMBLY_ACC=CAM_ASM_000229 /LENGTH=70 /DNA_ID=CAMNT_0017757961 /DNA_START=1008 /DNA_END=1216 /DNA_ORIENTATION=+